MQLSVKNNRHKCWKRSCVFHVEKKANHRVTKFSSNKREFVPSDPILSQFCAICEFKLCFFEIAHSSKRVFLASILRRDFGCWFCIHGNTCFFSLWFWEWFHHPKAMVIFEAFGRFGWENICPKKIWAEIFFGQGQRGHENLEPILKVTKRKKTWKFTFGQILEKTLDKKETHGNCYYYVTHFLTEPWSWKGWLSGWVISDRLNQFPAAHPARIFWTDPSKSPGHHAKLAVPTLGNSTWNSLE